MRKLDKTSFAFSDQIDRWLQENFPPRELCELRRIYERSQRILEYGSGSSTVLAASGSSASEVHAIESDKAFANRLTEHLCNAGLDRRGRVHWIDIGPTGRWGCPTSDGSWTNFIEYPLYPWLLLKDFEPDTILIDGRFRTACFLATCVNISQKSVVLFDDYVGRPRYHVVEKVVKPSRIIGRLAVFELEPKTYGPSVVNLFVQESRKVTYDRRKQ